MKRIVFALVLILALAAGCATVDDWLTSKGVTPEKVQDTAQMVATVGGTVAPAALPWLTIASWAVTALTAGWGEWQKRRAAAYSTASDKFKAGLAATAAAIDVAELTMPADSMDALKATLKATQETTGTRATVQQVRGKV